VVLYEMATGWLPFRGEHEAALTYSIANEEPLPARTVREDIPSELDQIITKALQKDRTLRYQSADEVVADLQKLQRGTTGTAKTVVAEKRSKILWIVAAAIVVLGAIGILFFMQSSRRTDASSKTIAVLPFANLTEDKQEEYFSDGITDDILTQLAQIADINVISRTSIMQYKGTKKSIREISKELNAGVILEGSVRRAGDKVRIVAQLIDANSDRHLWAETYDREFSDILTIQSEIARNISTALHARISQKEREKLTTSTRENPELYRLLLQGKYYATRRDSANTMRGLETLQRALTIDSADARIWVALSMALTNRAALGPSNVQDVIGRARAAAQRAVALDDDLADGHAALAFILTTFDWDWQTADGEYKKALALEPGNAATLRRKGVLAMCLGRLDESIKLTQRAIELDPVNDANYLNLGICYYYSGRPREAIASLGKALDLNPLCPAAYQLWGANYIELGKIDSAIIITQKEADQVWRAFGLAIAYYAAGRGKESDQMLDVLVRNYKEGASYQIAAIYSYRNEKDLAFEWLEKAYELRDGGLSQMMGDPLLSNIQKDARYPVFLKKMRLIE